jgi:hypothetical protein
MQKNKVHENQVSLVFIIPDDDKVQTHSNSVICRR